jgi:tetratricopeptide (TPR) repeat protein
METSVETAQSAAGISLTPFERHVKQALRFFDDPDRLGRESPLASPYFLGYALRELPRPVTTFARGEVLRAGIRSAAIRLWRGALPASRDEMLEAVIDARRDPDDPRYSYVVLELRCFHQFVEPNRTSDIWEQPHLLPGSKSQHYRDFDAAVKRLAPVLLDSLRPTLRPERPRAPAALYGYDRQLAQLADALARGCAVALSGPGGVGKTSISAAAIERLADHPVFWYTLRPGFNDGANSLLFALGAFLHQYGALNLWQYLVTTNGVVGDLNLAAGLLRQDLATLHACQPILCFDDLEHLSTSNLALLAPAHAQLIDLIEGLRGATPLLLISQRSLPECDVHIELAGLHPGDVEQLWRSAGHDPSSQEIERFHSYTGGNPRLITLILALHHEARDVIASLDGDDATRSLLPAFQRLWRRLMPEERRALQRLSVYQGYAPDSLLPPETLEALVGLRLVERDAEGGIALLPAFATIVHDELSPELREKLHGEAALVRLERGEYTAAAYHFARSNQESRAVQVWLPQRQHAIARGEADAARLIFGNISRQRLDRQERKALDVIRAELRQMAGQREEALRELEQADWSDQSEATSRLWMLRGEMQEALGYPDRALESYADGLHVTTRLLGQLAALRLRRGMLFQHRRDHQASWQEIHRAEFELSVMRGIMREEEGAYQEALESYQHCRTLAEQLDDDSLRAQAERWIAALYGRRQQLEQAVAHGMQAIAIFERLGDRVSLEKMRSNMAFIYVQTRQFHEALEVGAPAYAFFTAVRDPYFAGHTGNNLAEASFELGDLEDAARYAGEVLNLGHRSTVPYARFTLGQIDLAHGDTASAIHNFGDSLQIAQSNDDPYLAAYAERALGEAYLAAGNLDIADRHLQDALALFRQLGIAGEIAASEQLIAKAQAQRTSVSHMDASSS